MKSVEERLHTLPDIAENSGLNADEQLKRKILRAAREKETPRRAFAPRLAAALCALAVLIGAGAFALPALRGNGPVATQTPLIESHPAGSLSVGEKTALDVPAGSITIRSSRNPSYRSIWAPMSGGNFPLIGVNGRYYRMLTNPTSVSGSLLGQSLGTVDTFTSEPALAGRNGVCSNVAAQGETVYAVSGMNGAMAAANVNGQMRVFQRVSFGDNALVGGESLADTLKASNPVALELSGVGTVNDASAAQRLVSILVSNASFLRAGGSETNQSLLIQLSNGIVLQMAVNGERLIACGTWACPEFFEAFQEAMQ
ncbi:MAG: hypothetical protein IKP72_18500 [Clostridia bacterium]|jgi:hypothetical protein|nr:hypothetical protein [Clostridia bacterium]